MNSERFFIMRSQTTAIKAKRLLSANGITSSSFKSASPGGCAYVVSVASSDYPSAKSLLTHGGISFTSG
jgi:hypothetical protein